MPSTTAPGRPRIGRFSPLRAPRRYHNHQRQAPAFGAGKERAMQTLTTRKELQDRILSFVAAGARTADGALQERTYARLDQLVRTHFDGSPNQRSFERTDWRIIQRFFAHIFAQGISWAHIGEELDDEIQYLNEPTHDAKPRPRPRDLVGSASCPDKIRRP